MKMTPAPRFLHVLSVQLAENKISGIHAVEAGAAPMGLVVGNNSERLKDIVPGMVVYFEGGSSRLLKNDEEGENLAVFEDAILGSSTLDQLPGPLAREQNFVIAREPGLRDNGDKGIIVPRPRIH